MMRVLFATFSISLLLLIEVHCGEPKCGNTKHFRFDAESPNHKTQLSYCQYYRGQTCCNKTHTDKIIQNVYAYHEPNVSSDCRSIALNIGCSPCDPRIGTNQIQGICQSYCNQWYDMCRSDYFHFNKRGILTACSQQDIVCSKLSSITNNGTKLCQLSGFDVSHISINCYDGIKAKFTKPPNDNQWQTPIDKIVNMLQKSVLNKNLKLLIKQYSLLAFWQQMLVIGGFAYSLFMIFKGILNICSYVFRPDEQDSQQALAVDHEIDEEEKREEIRNKRLEYLMKQTMISEQVNLEKKLAEQLGLAQDNDNYQVESEDD